MVGATVLSTLLVLALAALLARVLGHDRSTQSAFLLSTAFPNAGNLALPILQLTFGQQGLDLGVAIFVTQSILTQSLGILVAARSELHGLAALRQVFRMPATYAVVAALLVRLLGVTPPTVVLQPLTLLAQASIPMMLIVLGYQIGAGIQLERWASLLAAVAVRLLVSAPLAYVAATLVGLSGMARGSLVIVSAMPVAVITTILAQEFKSNPKFVTNVVITSTACSLLTLTIVITVVKQLVGF
jgi:predicted permease